MTEAKNTAVIIEEDIALQAKEKRELLFNFYDIMMKGGDILSVEDIDIAMESLKLAQLDIKEREKRKIIEREAELLKQKMAEDEKHRRMAEVRAAKRAEKKRKERAAQITAMDLPLDYVNQYDDDARANVHCDTISEGLLVSLDALGLVDIEFISSVTGEEMKTVTNIAYQAFRECKTIKTITIPKSVKTISSYAFCGCKSLESVFIPKSVREIGECAFTDCENLKAAHFEHEKYMGGLSLRAFRGANNVTLYGTEKALGWLWNYKKDVPPFELHE